jgi:hypothetical protein
MKRKIYLASQRLVGIITALFLLSGCIEPNASISTVEVNSVTLNVGISPDFQGVKCDKCIILECSRSLNVKDLQKIEANGLDLGSSIDGMSAIAESNNPADRSDSFVSTRGVPGLDIYRFALKNFRIDKNKRYYALAMKGPYVISHVGVDEYLK